MSRFFFAMGLATTLAACGTKPESLQSMDQTESLESVEQTMADALLAEVEVNGATLSFYEYESGDVAVSALAPIGALPDLSGETLQDVFEAAAPGRDVPENILAADRRMAQARLEEVDEEPDFDDAEQFVAPAPSDSIDPIDGSIGQTRQALASSIDFGWFSSQFCEGWYEGVSGFFDWCIPNGTNGTFASAKRREAWGVACGDTGFARLLLNRSGTKWWTGEVYYGTCQAHRAWYKRRRTWKYYLGAVEQTARFAGEMGNDKQYFPPPGW